MEGGAVAREEVREDQERQTEERGPGIMEEATEKEEEEVVVVEREKEVVEEETRSMISGAGKCLGDPRLSSSCASASGRYVCLNPKP